jgi:hypothetical protein
VCPLWDGDVNLTTRACRILRKLTQFKTADLCQTTGLCVEPLLGDEEKAAIKDSQGAVCRSSGITAGCGDSYKDRLAEAFDYLQLLE